MEDVKLLNGYALHDVRLEDAIELLNDFCISQWANNNGCEFCQLRTTCKTVLQGKGFKWIAVEAGHEWYGEEKQVVLDDKKEDEE